MLRLPTPRLLPSAIGVMGLLLLMKLVSLFHDASAMLERHGAIGAAQAAVTASQAVPNSGAPTVAAAPSPAPAPTSVPSVWAPAAPPDAGPAMAMKESPPISDTERALLLDLRQRRSELDAREAAIGAREAGLASAEKRIETRADELVALQKKLETLEAARREREEAGWKGLVKTYETMKPRDAAAIFNDLDMPVLLQVLDRMKEAKAAPILAVMQPDRARHVTTELAQMRAKAATLPNGGAGG